MSIDHGQKISGELLVLEPAIQDINSKFSWYDARRVGICGRGWTSASPYNRLPDKLPGSINDNVIVCGTESAGMCVRFATDSPTITAKWFLNSSRLAMPHMTSIGVSGLDLYTRTAADWQLVGVGVPDTFPGNEKILAKDIAPGLREYILYLPLYNGLTLLHIGIEAGARFIRVPGFQSKTIVFYGTSIVQGACATRPGLAHTNILGRRLGMEIINLGFSGGAKLEVGMAELLAQLDPAVYVIDPVPNLEPGMIEERFEVFVNILRHAHPETPIIFCESFRFPDMLALHKDEHAINLTFRENYQRLISQGLKNTWYLSNSDYPGKDGADMGHPTDHGLFRMAYILEPLLKKALVQATCNTSNKNALE